MDIMIIGPWVLLAIGTAALILAIIHSMKSGMTKSKWWLWIFGFALCGVGIWGPEFISSYSSFIRTITNLYTSPSGESVTDALTKIGRGDLPSRLGDLTINYILGNPPADLDSMLDRSMAAAVNREGKEILVNAKAVLRGMRMSATLITRSLQASGNAEVLIYNLDPAMQRLVAMEILELPDSIRDNMGIDKNKLTSLISKNILQLKGGF